MPDIQCRFCGGRYHETTDKFTIDKPATGDMFRLKEKYVSWGWTSFPTIPSAYGGDLICPECCSPYCSQYFRVKVVGMDEWTPEPDTDWIAPPAAPSINDEMDRLMAGYDVDPPAPSQILEPGMARCPHCNYVCKASGLHFHVRSKHGDLNG